jgi:hypothetical protein
MSAIPIITPVEFSAITDGPGQKALVVHIAGKGNMPTIANQDDRMLDGEFKPDGSEYREMYKKYSVYAENYARGRHFQPYKSFNMQAAVFDDLNENVEAEFHQILVKLTAILDGLQRNRPTHMNTPSRLVFTFDGDNYQDNSPFTKGIRLLIRAGYAVYAFKDKPPSKPTHFASWVVDAEAPYTALVSLEGMLNTRTGKQLSPKDYTKPRCDVYVSYGYPPLVSIYQPQKNDEILPDGSDKWGRLRPSNAPMPGLVMSSLSSELSDDFKKDFSIAHTPRSKRYLMLYHRKSR